MYEISHIDCLPCINLTHLFLIVLCITDLSLGKLALNLSLLRDLATCK